MTRRGIPPPAGSSACVVVAVCVMAMARANLARAQPPPFQPTELPELAERPRLRVFRTEAASDCPSTEALAASVGHHLGWPALETGEGNSEARGFDVYFDRSDEGYQALVLRRGARGSERRLADPGTSCAGLAEALAVTLAILLDETPQPTPRTAEGRGIGRSSRRPPPAQPSSRPEPARFGVALLAEGVGTYAVLDGAWAGAAGEIEVTFGPVSVAPGVLFLPTQVVDAPPGTIDVGLFTGTLRGCIGFESGIWRADGCGTFAIGALSGTGSGFTENNRSAEVAWLAAGASVLGRVRLAGPVSASARFGLLVPLREHAFLIEQRSAPGEAIEPPKGFRQERVGAHAGLGVTFDLW